MIKTGKTLRIKLGHAVKVCKKAINQNVETSDIFDMIGDDAWILNPIKELISASIAVESRLIDEIDEINEIVHKNNEELDNLKKEVSYLKELVKENK